LLPWLMRGGADLEALHYIDVLAEDPANKVLCILTEVDPLFSWVDRLPESAAVMKFGKIAEGLSTEVRVGLLLRLILQESPKVIHNLNSPTAYRLLADHGKAIRHSTKIFVSTFCPELLPDGTQIGYPFEYLNDCIDVIDKVFTDSKWFIDYLANIYDHDRDRFVAHYMPPDKNLKMLPPITGRRNAGEPLNVLWASRLDRQKRPDVLADIVKRCQDLPVKFHVYGGWLDLPDEAIVKRIKASANVNFVGPFNGFASLPVRDMDVFLYTSSWDGLPNVLLEATLSGLPIIAPPVGGIPELLGDGAGFLVSNADDVDGYVAALKTLIETPSLGVATVEKAQMLAATRHSWESFRSAVKSEPGYCTPIPPG